MYKLFLVSSHIEGITLAAGEVAGRASDMGIDGIDEVGDRACGMYGTGLLTEPLQGDRSKRLGIEVASDNELTEVRRMA